jgi:hypothetical protein
MEVPQGNSPCDCLKQTKISFFFFFYFFFFSYTKSENKRVEKVLLEGVGSSGRRENVGKWCRKGEYGTNTVYMFM